MAKEKSPAKSKRVKLTPEEKLERMRSKFSQRIANEIQRSEQRSLNNHHHESSLKEGLEIAEDIFNKIFYKK